MRIENSKILLALVLPLIVSWSTTASAAWPFAIGSASDERVVVTKTSATGDVVIAGHFNGTIELPDGEQLISNGQQDVFVMRLSPTGELIWAANGGSEFGDVVNDMALDEEDNVYIVGEFFGSASFGGSQIASEVDGNGDPTRDGYLAKLDPSGRWQWARRMGGATNQDRATAVATLEGRNGLPPVPDSVVVGGAYACEASFDDPDTGGLAAGSEPLADLNNGNCFGGSQDLFLARYSARGDGLWAVDRGNAASGFESVTHIEIDANGRAVAAGTFAGSGGNVFLDADFVDSNGDPTTEVFSNDNAFPYIAVSENEKVSQEAKEELGDYSLVFRGNPAYTWRGFFDASDATSLSFSLKVMRGTDEAQGEDGIYSDRPEAGDNFEIGFSDADDNWVPVFVFEGGNPQGEIIEFDNFPVFDPRALHSGVRFRLRSIGLDGTKNGGWADWWHLGEIKISKNRNLTAADTRPMAFTITNLTDSKPTLSSPVPLPGSMSVADFALAPDGRVYMTGSYAGSLTAGGGCTPLSGSGSYLFGFEFAGGDFACKVLEGIEGNVAGTGVAIDDNENVFTTGYFSDAIDVDGLMLASHNANPDIYVASWDEDGALRWATGGGAPNEADNIELAGGDGVDMGNSIATDGIATVFVGGEFTQRATFGEDATVESVGGADVFVANLGTNGKFAEEKAWTAGVDLDPPPNAKLDDFAFQPDFRLNGEDFDAIGEDIFEWVAPIDGKDARLIPLQPFATVEVRWRVEGEAIESESRISTVGGIGWPAKPCSDPEANTEEAPGCFQVHVVGAPVQAEPATGTFRLLRLVDPQSGSSNPSLDSGVFKATRTGNAVLSYVNGPEPDQLQYDTEIEIVRTLPATATPQFVDGVPAEIGEKITDPFHNEPGKTGFVANENAFYDGNGPDAAYNRNTRTGSIIPVNRTTSARPQDVGRELVVVWFRRNDKDVFWPQKGVRYDAFWPFDPDRIIITSEQGGEVLGQQPLDPQVFEQARVYQQNDQGLPGYNPNDEHAIMAPSNTGTPFEAVFALRSDFGSKLEGDEAAASDPYVLVKYFDSDVQEWKFRVYEVDATGGGFPPFRFSGTAGTTVAPPYPLSLLPGCADTRAVGQPKTEGAQPKPPFFQDYKNQLWAKSKGEGSVRYSYPPQPGFSMDLDKDNVNDIEDFESGECVPWLARLPVDQGGSGSNTDPIEVAYEISWPDDVPLLVSGETLLTPKRGLPDILNQAGVAVVFDELQETKDDALPSDTLAQIIDPLNPRVVMLDQIPGDIATELQTDGTELILGNSDGSIKLQTSIRQRLAYDPLNKRLILTGIFDETGIGEPFLLPNVLSKRDRVALKTLDGGNGSEETAADIKCDTLDAGCNWDQAVEALFRLSRNPNGIRKICEDESIDSNDQLVCNDSRPVNENDVLVGLQDEVPAADPADDNPTKGDGILEPFQGVGVRAALTAGLSQGSGYLTLAFNDDESLNPLPVSLQVIEVGCLVSPEGADPSEADIFSSHQGQLQIIEPDNIFDEQLVLRHSNDFGGNPDAVDFEWFFHPDVTGDPPLPLPDPENGQLNGWIQFPVDEAQGAVEISIEGANIQTLSDNWYVARYRGLPTCNNGNEWSIFAGDPTATPADPSPQLAEGWVKRVLKRLNPFEARVQDFAKAATNNFASMLVQLGERFEGPVPLTNDPDVINDLGLIEAYTTVMNRALDLSVNGTPPVDFGPANNAILLVASRIVDFYTLLGNEAFADAQDPTIGISTSGGDFSLAPTIFNFQNQMDSVLQEELTLLRGRDENLAGVAGAPVYNRLFWNFTTGDGEVAYSQSYNISDQNFDGVIDEFDARIMFPQGHGDAWGHYLTATDIYYNLLNNEFYTWNPRFESITVAGAPINVDFLDERQFAETAAAKARTGAEIVDMTYREKFVADPQGQFQGYEDTDPDRAWGLSEWGSRAGQGAYFDWVTINSILPDEDPDPTHVGIEKVDRTTVSELDEIVGYYTDVQAQVDEADEGLNPLGLADNVVVFDMDPSLLDRFNKTNTEQVLDRAMAALGNAVDVWDFANTLSKQMRRNQDEVEDLQRDSRAQETDFANQLIEIFGTPYPDDMGPGGTYPAGYDGADLYKYMLIDVPALAGTSFDFDDGIDPESGDSFGRIREFTGEYTPVPNGINFFDWTPSAEGAVKTGTNGQSCSDQPLSEGCALGEIDLEEEAVDENGNPVLDADGNPVLVNRLDVEYTTIESPDIGFWFTKPDDWTGQRRAPGQLQQILQQMLQSRIALKKALVEYDRLREEIDAKIDELDATFQTTDDNLNITIAQRDELLRLTVASQVARNSAIVARRIGEFTSFTLKDTGKCIPKNLIAGLSFGGDTLSGANCAIQLAGSQSKLAADTIADGLDIAANATEAAKEDVAQTSGIETAINNAELDLFNVKGEIDEMIRQEPVLRAEVFARAEAIKQHVSDYKATLARGLRTMERLKSFRKNGAAGVQEYRYQDMAFRIFRNDALQKYRASFDMAARYAYLAASAYDYDTNLLGSDTQAGQEFLTNIVRERSLGQVIDGEPQPGSPGLASVLAQLGLNFDVLKGQMGFNNPQVETNRFSLREELFRIPPGPEGDAEWRAKLEEMRVDNLWNVEDFRKFARPFAPESAGPQPGLVIEMPTTVTFGQNFFGWELGPGDSSYDSSQFATRIRSVGSWFQDYAGLPLADDPRVYLIPAGADVLRTPDPFDFRTREWQIVEQVMPVPFPIESSDLERFDWFPAGDTLSGSPTQIRRHGRFRAFHLSEPFDDSEVTADSRLVGRSVWNTRWLLVIPGGTFLNDPVEGLETFIDGERISGSVERDGQGVSDILIFFKTYAYSGF